MTPGDGAAHTCPSLGPAWVTLTPAGDKRTLDFGVGYFLSRVLYPKEARLKLMVDMVALLFAVVMPWFMPKRMHTGPSAWCPAKHTRLLYESWEQI